MILQTESLSNPVRNALSYAVHLLFVADLCEPGQSIHDRSGCSYEFVQSFYADARKSSQGSFTGREEPGCSDHSER